MKTAARSPLRPEMAEVPAYATSTASAPIRLDRNESPEEMPQRLREEVLARLASAKWSRYPDPYAAELKIALGEREGLSPDRVIVGNGSNSLFLSFFLASGAPGRRIGICPPIPSQQNTFTGKLTRPMLQSVFDRARQIVGP